MANPIRDYAIREKRESFRSGARPSVYLSELHGQVFWSTKTDHVKRFTEAEAAEIVAARNDGNAFPMGCSYEAVKVVRKTGWVLA